MKKLTGLILSVLIIMSFSSFADDEILRGKKVRKFPFYIYKDAFNRLNHYAPTGWMGDYGDIKINQKFSKFKYKGTHCMKVSYSARRKQGAGWGGIYWQNPPNNWGTQKGGYDLRGATKVIFFARGHKGRETIEFKVGGITGQYSDSSSATSGIIELKARWKRYVISLQSMDLSYIGGGFCVVFAAHANPEGAVFYLDEIRYER